MEPNYILTGNGALEGFSGRFGLQETQLILKTDATDFDPFDFILSAGSMAAYRDRNLGFRDQRGLIRQATSVQPDILTTTVTFQRTIDDSLRYELTSTRQPIALEVEQGQFWQLWFRDLPIQVRLNETTEENQQPTTTTARPAEAVPLQRRRFRSPRPTTHRASLTTSPSC